MITLEKPPLDEDLLIHFGVKGMRWGHRKPAEAGTAKPRAPLTKNQKTALKIVAGAGLAAGAYALARRGMTPRTKALSDKSTKIGFKAALKTLKVIGKVTVKTVPKVAKATAKVTTKVATTTTKLTAKGVKKVSINSSKKTIEAGAKAGQAIARSYNNFQAKRALRNAPQTVSAGSRIARRLLGRVGSRRV